MTDYLRFCSFIIPVSAALGYIFLFSRLANVRFIFAVPAIIASLISFLYLSALGNLLYYTTYLVYAGGLLCLFIYLIIKKDMGIRFNLYSREVTALTVVCVLFGIYTMNAEFHAWDDFSHWGVFSKELLNRHIFESHNIDTSIIGSHAHYPRGSAVFHYFMMSLPGFSEGGALFAHFLLHLVFLAPLMGNRNVLQSLVLISVILALVVLYTTGIRSIYNDSTVGVMFGSIIAVYILEVDKRKAMLLALPVLLLLPLFREIGLLLGITASIIITFSQIRDYRLNKGPVKKSDLLICMLMFLLPVFANALWMDYFKATHVSLARTEHSINNILGLVQTFGAPHELLVISYLKFLLKFLVKEGSIGIYLMLALGYYSIRRYQAVINGQNDIIKAGSDDFAAGRSIMTEYRFHLALALGGFAIFALWRLYLYFFTFAYVEAIKAASLSRYLGSYCLVFAFIACAYIKGTIFRIGISKKELVFMLLVLAVALITIIKNVIRIPAVPHGTNRVFNTQTRMVEKLLSDKFKVDINFSNKQNSFYCYKLNYKLAPYLASDLLRECLGAVVSYNPKNVEVEESGFDPEACSQETCRILYIPFMNRLEQVVYQNRHK